jgi:phosphate/sulfate permease
MKEEYKAFLVSVFIGVIVGAIVGYGVMLHGKFDKFFFDKNVLAFSVINPLSALALSFILQKKFPGAWVKIEARIFCVVSMLLVYMCGAILGMIYYDPGLLRASGVMFFVLIPLFLPFVAYFSLTLSLIPLAYSNILVIAVAYLATRGIEPLYKRIIWAFVMIFLICLTAASPLGIHAMLVDVGYWG